MPKDDNIYLGHMLDTARQAVFKATKSTYNEFKLDENLRLALIHLIQIVGEAARRVSPQFCERHPEIPWKAIIGMRHKVV
ncbi:MAG: DUF86 domain-containing protein, partial [Deltaproteobacteria bacterium]|nr:DUF86 domain-containing protein [Deltaproteobacteria bacterium]